MDALLEGRSPRAMGLLAAVAIAAGATRPQARAAILRRIRAGELAADGRVDWDTPVALARPRNGAECD